MSDVKEWDAGELLRLDRHLCFALYAASRATIDIYRPLLDESGITYPQYLVLLILWEHGTRSVKDIGTLLYLDSGTLSPLLKRLEAAGFIRRQRRVEDERVVDISLTAEGQALKSRASSIHEKFACEVDLTLEEYVNLLTSLKNLTERLHARQAAS